MALEEALFISVIKSRQPLIRIWENISPCIYLGIGKKYAQEVFLDKCQKDNIPVIRRFSGGGTVYQDKGSINISFILPLEKFSEFKNINNSYKEIHKIFCKILNTDKLILKGTSDFCINNKKISGNAQARRHNTLLHHGTIINNMNIKNIEQYLKLPQETPEYRKNRGHLEFLTSLKKENVNINLFTDYPKDMPTQEEKQIADNLLKEKYTNNIKWNFKL